MKQLNRDTKFDNLKGIMIFLVVFCHFIEKMYSAWTIDVMTKFIYYTVYLFHMPVFVFISGFFSKGGLSDNYIKKTISGCLIPYLICNFGYCLIGTGGSVWGSLLGFTFPQWTLWYMLSLFFWRLFARPAALVKWSFPLAVLLSLYAGFTELGGFLALGRTVSFFPYFLAGYLVSAYKIEAYRNRNIIVPVLAFAFALLVSIFIQQQGIGISALYMSTPYKDMSGMTAILVRMLLLTTGFVCILGFVLLISDKQSILSMIGRNSVVIYLVHSGIIRILAKLAPDQINSGVLCIALSSIFSIAVCLLFGNDLLGRAYRFIMTLISNIVLKSETT